MKEYIKIDGYEYKIITYVKDLGDKVQVNLNHSSKFIEKQKFTIINKGEIYSK